MTAITSEIMHVSVPVERWRGTGGTPERDAIVVEEPLEIRVNDRSLAVTMRTPGQDEALAVGFLHTEGILHSREDLWDVVHCSEPDRPDHSNIVSVYVPPDRAPEDMHAGRQRYASSACGLCGKATIDEVLTAALPLPHNPRVSASVVYRLPDLLREAQTVFQRTGGLHAAGLFTAQGELLALAEDVGRHNAVDKVVGQALLRDIGPLDETVLLVSGRAGFEIVQKALVARIPAVCSISAPSSLAVDLARRSNMLLIGFLRGETMNVYAGELVA